jgi:glycerophosphoryl diester phosphodiesterase
MKRILCLFLFLLPAAAQTRRVVAIAHRGEHLRNPENTMPAFREAIRLGADYIELDVRTTADGILVLSHDSTVDRCTNGHGEVAKMTFDQIRALDAGMRKSPEFAGTRVPTFDEALELARGKIGVYVDVKQVSAKDLVRHIEDHGMVDQVVIYSGRISKEIQDLNPGLKIMPESVSVAVAESLVSSLHPKVIAFGARDFTPDVIAVAKHASAQIYVDRMGDTDNPAGWQSAIDAGADGIQTDLPGELVKFLSEKRYR